MSLESRIDQLISDISEMKQSLESLDNGKFEEIRKQLATVAANSRLIASQVASHGVMIAEVEKKLVRLNFRCPLMGRDAPEADKGES